MREFGIVKKQMCYNIGVVIIVARLLLKVKNFNEGNFVMTKIKELKISKRYSKAFNALLEIAQQRNIVVLTYDSERAGKPKGLWLKAKDVETIVVDTYNAKGKHLLHIFAHEIGHSVLHGNILDAAAYHSNRSYRSELETQASEYASRLLQEIYAS